VTGRFADKTALVVGGCGGIGWAIAEAFASEGARVTVTGVTEAEVAGAASRGGTTTRACLLDATEPAAVAQLMAEHPTLDALVSCAGIIRRLDEYDLDVFERVVAVNLTATMRLSEAARPLLGRSKGAIVSIASMYSFFGAAHAPAYAASKGGIVQLTKSLARAYAPEGIRVNAVAPGWIKTPITQPVYSNPVKSEPIVSRTPAGRWGEPQDVAGPVLFLCSEAAAFVTGVVLPVDGGYLLTG
jgi:NAD(P)-dependent dehydrogenase (short-subunit alcohol dehydrogenase family)